MHVVAHSEQGWLVVFAAQAIQTYILRSDKLKEIVGASELVDGLARDLLDSALSEIAMAFARPQVLSRTAGGARIIFADKADAENFARYWPLLVARHAPGLAIAITVVEITTHPIRAIVDAEKKLMFVRQLSSADLPEAGHCTLRHQRSGRPICEDWINQDGASDAESGRKYAQARSGQKRLLEAILRREVRDVELRRDWPLEMDNVATEKSGIAIFHADGNGLGERVISLLDRLAGEADAHALSEYAKFCAAVEETTHAALKLALEPIIRRAQEARTWVPFRPLVCAGDDVTVILRDSDAVDFARTFLRAMERGIRSTPPAWGLNAFTICGALVFTRPTFPFADAYALCESACANAKKSVERRHTALSLLRVASSLPGEYSDYLQRERTLPGNGSGLLTMNPYLVGPSVDQPASLDHLLELVELLKKLPRGALRETVVAAYGSVRAADDAFARFMQVLNQEQRATFKATFGKLVGNASGGLWTPSHPPGSILPSTPLYDAIELSGLSLSTEERDTSGPRP